MDCNWDSSCEPMDIDLSSNSAMEVSYMDHDRVPSPAQELRKSVLNNAYNNDSEDKELIFIVENDKECKVNDTDQNKSSYRFIKFVTLTPLIILLLSFVFFYTFNLKCYETANLALVKETLRNNIFGQTAAIENFIQALEVEDNSKLVILYGGTGVGKTLTVSLLLKNIVNYTNIYHHSMPAFLHTFSTEFMIGLILCKSSVIIIDDISINDTGIKGKIKEIIVESRNLHKKVTIILIYNCYDNGNLEESCGRSFVSKLGNTFSDIPVYKSLVKFEPLSDESLLKCIQSEFRRKELSYRELMKIKKNFNVQLDGCKGVYQKMKYFNVV